jgi:hypothetical protein
VHVFFLLFPIIRLSLALPHHPHVCFLLFHLRKSNCGSYVFGKVVQTSEPCNLTQIYRSC